MLSFLRPDSNWKIQQSSPQQPLNNQFASLSITVIQQTLQIPKLVNIILMSKQHKDFLQDISMDYSTYKQLVGISTRSQAKPRSVDRNDDKKRTSSKKEAYVPPQIGESRNSCAIEFKVFKEIAERLLGQVAEGQTNPFMRIDTLYAIHQQAASKGGIVEVSSIGIFPAVMRSALISAGPGQVYESLTAQFMESVRQLIFSIEFIHKNSHVADKIYQLGLINFVSKEQLSEYAKDKVWGLKYFNEDLTLFQEGAEGIKIDKQIFNLDYMCNHYAKEIIDIRIQNPLDYGFKPAKLKNKKYEMTLGEYRFYQLNFMDPAKMRGFKHAQQLGKGQVFFGVNFEPSDQMLNREIKKNVEGTFLDFHGDFDLMSYLDTDVPGCSLPQMYFKTPGCWTGGHQENVCMSALNINHGPDYSEWYTLELEHIEQLREELNSKYNMLLYTSEGLWYEKLDWFIERGYPVKRFLQRKDDIVVTGPGTLHWVRSFGIAMQTSWNIFPKNYQQFQAAFIRHKINKEIAFHKSDTIPLKQLILQYLNHERTIMPANTRQLCVTQLEAWLDEETPIVDKLAQRIEKREYFYLKNLESFCCMCRQEVLVYFLPAPLEKEQGISCLECFQKEKTFDQIPSLFFKVEIFYLESLIELCKSDELNFRNPDEIEELCKGVHVGELPIKCKVTRSISEDTMANQCFLINDEQEIENAEREIFHEDPEKFQLYENYLKEEPKEEKKTKRKGKDRSRPSPQAKQQSGKMMAVVEEGEMVEEKSEPIVVVKIEKIDAECQTETRVEVVEKELGEISSSSSSEKKKKKSKSKKKKSRKEERSEDSPRFKTSSQECKARDPSPRSSRGRNQSRGPEERPQRNNERQQNVNRWGSRTYENRDNYRDNYYNRNDSYRDRNDGYQNNRNEGYQNRNDNYRGNNDNYNNRDGNWQNRGRQYGNWNQNRGGRYQGNEEMEGQQGRRRNFNDWNQRNQRNQRNDREDNYGRDDGRDGNEGGNRNYDNNWRGRGRGRGRGGYRDYNNYDRNDRNRGGFNRENNDTSGQQTGNNLQTNPKPRQDEPDEY